MVEMRGSYQGEKRCEVAHGPSGTLLSTDAPKDNNGRGESFSPTDLVGVALATCALTTMAIVSERDGQYSLKGSTFHLTKEMSVNPRKIARLTVNLKLPKNIDSDYREKLVQIAKTCPVYRSLHPEVEMPLNFEWVL